MERGQFESGHPGFVDYDNNNKAKALKTKEIVGAISKRHIQQTESLKAYNLGL